MNPAAFIASISAPAILDPPEMIAPTPGMRRPGYAAVPALNQAADGGVRESGTPARPK